jgi:hypothetical protein
LGDEQVVDGADFYVGERELGHIHLDGEAHIAVPAAVRKALITAGLALPFRWSAAFVAFEIATKGDVARAAWLFQLAYDRLQGVRTATLVGRCASLVQASRVLAASLTS